MGLIFKTVQVLLFMFSIISLFKHYNVMNGHEVLIGNNDSAKVTGEGNVELQFISIKKFVLVNVLHVPNIREYLASASLMSKKGFKTVLQFGEVIMSMNGQLVGRIIHVMAYLNYLLMEIMFLLILLFYLHCYGMIVSSHKLLIFKVQSKTGFNII